jgi:hypothetical protein
MLPTRCPHCKAELPSVGRFCGACGRRIEGWRGVIAAPPDLFESLADSRADSRADGQADGGSAPSQATPRELPGSEDKTRPVRPSKNLAAARASVEEESRRPTGEMPGVGHELRAKAPDHRVHTSPLGNVLPLAFMDALGASVQRSESDGDSAPAPSAPSGRSGPRAEPRIEASGRRISPTDETPTRRSDASSRSGRSPSRDSGASSSPSARSGRRAVSIRLESDASSGRNEPARSRRRDPDTPEPVRFDATHHIDRPRRMQRRFIRVLRALIWGLLWLSLGGAVAYAVAHFFHRAPSQATTPVGKPPAPPPIAATARPPKPRPAAAKLGPLGRDLVVSVPPSDPPAPAGSGPNPGPPPRPVPGAPTAPSALAAPAAPPALPPPAAPEPDLKQLTPQQRAAVEQTLANIEFVAGTYRAQVRACYERAARSRGFLPGGRIEVAITLTDAGMAESVLTVENTFDEAPLLATCIEQRVAEWRFPRPSGPLRTFRFPFVFAPTSSGITGSAPQSPSQSPTRGVTPDVARTRP